MKILIIRHAEPDYSIDSLTPKGWREAHLLAKRLSDLPISDIYCSPLGRAQDTAQPTLEAMNKSAPTLPWLHEFRGKIWDEEKGKKRIPWNLMPEFWTKQPQLFDKDEWYMQELMQTGNVEEIYKETVDELDKLLESYGYVRDGYIYRCEQNLDTTIVIFCHFALGMVLVSHFAGVAPTVLWQSFFLPTSSVTTIVTEEKVKGEVFFKCMQLGDTSHLYAGGEPVSGKGIAKEFFEQIK